MKKAIILCYSFEGYTLQMATFIKENLNIDLHEIKPLDELKSKGFYKYIWGGRQVVFKKKPELKPFDIDFDAYDLIFLGSPIWAGTFAPAIRTILEDGIFKDKEVAYFYTHEGGAGKALVRGEKAINMFNSYIGSLSLLNHVKNLESNKNLIISWAHEMIESK
ncbi:MAG: hypothetical protein K8Q99_07825 [Acholeplasmataceae bacterium]|nr:hypothetical protein [Acholeplasmataceae bacterium]